MTIPSQDDIAASLLQMLEDGKGYEIGDVTDKLAKIFDVTPQEREKKTVTGRKKFDVTVRWTVSRLRKAGLLKNVTKGTFKITQDGMKLLENLPDKITDRYLEDNYPSYSEWKSMWETSGNRAKPKQPTATYGLVSIIDVLGIKGSWKQARSVEIQEKWNDLLDSVKQRLGEEFNGRFKLLAFSDTIFITVESNDDKKTLLSFSDAMWRVIMDSIDNNMPIRGCFTLGEFYHKDTLFLGSAIDEAAQYFEQPQWIGISAAPRANSKLDEFRESDPESVNAAYARTDLPLKSSVEQDAWGINWPRQCYREKNKMEDVEDMLKTIDSMLKSLSDLDIAIKWRKTRRFCNELLTEIQRQTR